MTLRILLCDSQIMIAIILFYFSIPSEILRCLRFEYPLDERDTLMYQDRVNDLIQLIELQLGRCSRSSAQR